MAILRETAISILKGYVGFPALPTGQPCGALAYTWANRTVTRRFDQSEDGQVTRQDNMFAVGQNENTRYIQVPYMDPHWPVKPQIYYAVIETDPIGILVPTIPKGSQDLLATLETRVIRVELGQEKQLSELLGELPPADESGSSDSMPLPPSTGATHNTLTELHIEVVTRLLALGYVVQIEDTFTAAIRETREEHGFDYMREYYNVVRLQELHEWAISKRSLQTPIQHHLYAVEVSSFEMTLPCKSYIIEDKNPERQGYRYIEQGLFLTLPQMAVRLAILKENLNKPSSTTAFWTHWELEVATSRLHMMGRIQLSIVLSINEGQLISA